MKKTDFRLGISALVKWLGKSILFLGLVTFSGHVSEFSVSNAGTAQTELNEVRSTSFKNAFKLAKAAGKLHHSLLPAINRSENFTYYLHHQKHIIAVKLKSNSEEIPIIHRDSFLLHYSTSNSEEYHTNPKRG